LVKTWKMSITVQFFSFSYFLTKFITNLKILDFQLFTRLSKKRNFYKVLRHKTQKNKQTNKLTNKQTYKQTNKQTNRQDTK
jgi:hypothetical protein